MKKIHWKQKANRESGGFRFLKDGKLFYILLFLCIVVVGTTGYVVRERQAQQQAAALRDAANQVQTTQIPVSPQQEPEPAETPAFQAEVVQAAQGAAAEADKIVEPEVSAEPVQAEQPPEPVKLIMPAGGEILTPHSDTNLVYSKTLEDWRLHQGMDIRADIGAAVSAAADGTVVDFYEDPRLGITIVIDHGQGLKTKYSNLSSAEMVEMGKPVKKGDAIATVGDTAAFEVADEAHLHFEVWKDDVCVQPTDYLVN